MTRVRFLQHVATTTRRASTAPRPPPPKSQAYQNAVRPARDSEESPSRNVPASAFAKSRALPWVLASITVGAMGFYIAQLYVDASRPCTDPSIREPQQQKDVSGRYEDTADSFDSEVGLSERLMLVNRMRRKLAKKCMGHVLEVSCGTGRNLGYFDIGKDSPIASLTFVDLSPQMVEVCKKKWNIFYGGKSDKLKRGLIIRFLTGSALESMPSPPDKEKYDTIIQTMGLCSTPSPTELLSNMAKHLDIANADARIYLLEHGRSYQPWLNNILDKSAEKHAEFHGCWYNRDIGKLVEDAAQATGLEVVNERRHHLGTTWVFELKFDPELAKKTLSAVAADPEPQHPSGWLDWLGLR